MLLLTEKKLHIRTAFRKAFNGIKVNNDALGG